MENQERFIIIKLEISKNKLLEIHALEIINNELTGLYFHAYPEKNLCKYNDMYYLARNQNYCENYLENFKKFVGF